LRKGRNIKSSGQPEEEKRRSSEQVEYRRSTSADVGIFKRILLTDSGYQGIKKIHANSEHPKKKSKKNPLTKGDKKNNQELSRDRVANGNIIGMLKRFKIISDKYRNRRKRFGLRFNLIAAIYNGELQM
jgi:hypothetical protein